MTNLQHTALQLALELPRLKKGVEVALRDWRWTARRGDHSKETLAGLKTKYEAAVTALADAEHLLLTT